MLMLQGILKAFDRSIYICVNRTVFRLDTLTLGF